MRMAIVEWIDSNFKHGWFHKDEEAHIGVSRCVSAGFINEKADCVQIIQSLSENNMADAIAIPKIAIKRIRYLRIKK